MLATPIHRIIIILAIYTVLLCQGLFGQKTSDAEIDIAKCWSYALADSVGEQIAADESLVFVGLNGARIEALSQDGKKIWSSEFGGKISSNIIFKDDKLFFVTSEVADEKTKSGGSKLRWVSKDTGVTNWTMTLPDAKRHYLGLFNRGVIVVSNTGEIKSIDVKSGKVEWARHLAEEFVGEPSITGSSVTLATTGKQIFNVSIKNGEILSLQKYGLAVTAISSAENDGLILGDERGNISAWNGGNKPVWTFKTGGEISKLFAFNGHVLAASHDNFVYFLSVRNGDRIWKIRLTSRVGHIAKVSDRFALISSFEESGAVLTDMSNGRVAGRIVLAENESLSTRPTNANGMIFVLTNAAVYGHSITGCPQKNKGSLRPISPSTASLK